MSASAAQSVGAYLRADIRRCSFGYRRGRSPKDALRKVWKEIQSGSEWIVDADLRDFFGSADHEKPLTLVAQRVADSRVLRLIKAMLKAGSYSKGQLFPKERGTPQGSVVSPVLSNILLTPFDREMRLRGYQLTRFADDWVVTCRSAAEARAAMDAARRILKQLGVELHPQKTRIVHVRYGFEFLGYKIKCGWRKLYLPGNKIRSQARQDALYAYPKEKSSRRESCIRENRTCSLGGGRRPALHARLLRPDNARFESTEISSGLALSPCGQVLPRNWMIFRRSRLDGLPAGNCSNCFIDLRSAATFRRSSRLASVSRYSVCATEAGPRSSLRSKTST